MMDDLPTGFRAGATGAAFKKPGRDDLGIIVSERPCTYAGLFTTNLFKAAPVRVCEDILASGSDIRAVIANSGQANSCTGEEGARNCREIQELAARDLGIKPSEILLLSTGVIGAQFDMAKWRKALPKLIDSLGSRDAEGFTRAFMTTDAFPKFVTRVLNLSQGAIRLTVMAKGAGMICPNMATMLCVVLTDAACERAAWQQLFTTAVNKSFNRVSVDGDTSTNDSIIGLANGASGVELATQEDREQFDAALTDVLQRTARMLVKDGEGAKRIMHIRVSGAASDGDAGKAARAIGNSQLVKTAIYGGDANWGRIINAIGYSGAKANPAKTGLRLCGIERFRNGQPVNDELEPEISAAMTNDEIEIEVDLGSGQGSYELWASDLGHEYVSLNSDYRS